MFATEEEIKQLIKNLLAQQKNLNVKSIELSSFEDADEKGRASQRMTAVITFSNNMPHLDLFLKVCSPENLSISFLNDKLSLFDKEAAFYSEILPFMNKFHDNFIDGRHTGLSLKSFFLRYFGCHVVDKDVFLILEKFNTDEYLVTDASEFHDETKIKCVMESLGIFHATSFCMKFLIDVDFSRDYPILADKLFNPENQESIGQFFINNFKAHLKVIKAVLKEMHKDPFILEELCFHELKINEDVILKLELLSDKIMIILHHVQDCNENYKVVCHGDCHLWNIAFHNTKSTSLKYFDFQMIRYTSGLIDVQHYLSQVTTPSTRKHVKRFLGFYFEKFQEFCKAVDLPTKNQLAFTDVEDEYKRTCPWQFVFGLVFILPRFVNKDFYTKLNDATTDQDVMSLLYNQHNYVSTFTMIKVCLDIIVEAEASGTINEMERLSNTV